MQCIDCKKDKYNIKYYELKTNVYDDVNIYSNDNTLYVEAEVGANISVFSLVGQCLYSATSVDDLTMIDNIVERCVIVKVNNSIYKVIM